METVVKQTENGFKILIIKSFFLSFWSEEWFLIIKSFLLFFGRKSGFYRRK